MTRRGWALAIAGGLLWLAVVAWRGSERHGDICNHYTDHLRHQSESLALLEHGFDIYRRPYSEVTAGLSLPCGVHDGLFPERTAPYPPLGVLAHWPFAFIEAKGVVSPQRAHMLLVLAWSAIAWLGAVLGAVLFKSHGRIALGGFLLVFAPLMLGMGANGFYDVLFVAAALLSVALARAGHTGFALVATAVSGALHFRALSLAPLGLLWLRDLWRERGHGRAQGLRTWAPLAAAVVLLVPAALAAVVVSQTLDTIPAHNPVHVSKKLNAALFSALSLGTFGVLLWARVPFTALSLLTALAAMLSDRAHGWWHAAVLLAPAVLLLAEGAPSSDPRRHRVAWLAVWAYAIAGGYLAFRHPLSPYWQWVDFALRGVR